MPESLRLLLVSQPDVAGVPRHLVELISILDRSRFEVEVACAPGSDLWRTVEAMTGVTLHPFSRRRGPVPSDVWRLARLIPLIRHADLVHAHSSKAGFIVRSAAVLTGRTNICVFTPHGWSFWSARGLEKRLYLAMEQLAARWCAAIITVSAFERESALALGVGQRANYHLVQNGVDLTRFSSVPRPVPNRVVMVARLAPPKRPDLVIDAVAAVRRAHPTAELYFIGDGPLRARSQEQARSLGLEGSIRFLGDRTDVAHLLSRASCLVLASDYEGCPLSVLEAMAAGLPVVVTRVGGINEVVSDGLTGFVVDPSPGAIASGIGRLLDDPTLAVAMGAAARADANRRFSRERMGTEVAAVYDHVLALRGR